MNLNQKGVAHIPLLLAAIGLIAFLVVSSSGEFQDRLFKTLYPKSSSFAASTTQLGTLSLTASGSGILVNLPIAGDDNNNATITLEYKKITDTTWTQGPVLTKSAVQGVDTTGDVKAAATNSAPDAIIVKFKKEIPEEDRKALSSRFNITFDSSIQSKDTEQVIEDVPESTNIFNRTFRSVFPSQVTKPKLDIIRFKVNPANRDKILTQLKANPDIEYAELDLIGESLFTPNDTYYASQQWDLRDINAPTAWDINQGNTSVVVAFIDTGLNTQHQDFAGRVASGGFDFIANTTNITDCYNFGHGTAVAGRITAATNNAIGIAGLAPGIKIMSVRDADCEGRFHTSTLAKALLYAADKGAKVISISQGTYAAPELILYVRDAINYATSKGVLVVAAGGNRSPILNPDRSYVLKPDGSIDYKGCYNADGEAGILYPAAYPGVIAVGATKSGNVIWDGSCPGSALDVVAPGAGVYTTKVEGGYGGASGTSFATPQVAALAGLIFSVNPSLTPQQVTGIILGTATDLGVPGIDDIYGYGRIDALKALQSAQSGVPIPTSTVAPTATPILSPTPTSSSNVGLSIPISTPTPAPLVFNNLSTTIPNLEPNTSYDIRITVADPDGLVGSDVVTAQIMTGGSLISTLANITATPTACNSYSSIGTVAWINSDLAKLSDGKFAGVPLATSSGSLTSNALACLGFGFNIPSNATIKGIKVSIKRARDITAGTAQDATVRLVRNGAVSSADRILTTEYGRGVTIDEHGGPSDLWGESWTPAQVNSDFGVAFAVKGNVSVGVDSITATVYYNTSN
jgi:subtilisin family serine protease